MRRYQAILTAAAALLAFATSARAAEKRVLIIGVDGMRPDSMEIANTPHIDALIAAGAYSNKAQIGDITVSGPGWATILTGVWRDKHGVSNNSFAGKNLAAFPDLFTRLESLDASLTTVSIAHWSPINTQIVGDADVKISGEVDAEVARLAAALLKNGTVLLGERRSGTRITADPQVMFLHLDELDGAGHSQGWNTTPGSHYMNTLETIDTHIGSVVSALHQRPGVIAGQEDWLVIVTSDHGGEGTGHGPNTPVQRTIPFIVSGPSAKQGGVIHHTPVAADVTAIALAHLGFAIDPTWGMDGRPAGLPTKTHYGQNLIFNGDAEWNTGYNDFANDGSNGGNAVPATVAGWVEIDALTVVRYGAPGFAQANDPGPTQRGSNFLAGGAGGTTFMTQTIDLADIVADIDTGLVRFSLSAYLGAQGDADDIAELIATFLDEAGNPIGEQAKLTGDSASRRRGRTGLFLKSLEGQAPAGARRVELVLTMHDDPGSPGNHAYADDLSLVFTVVPEPGSGAMVIGAAGLLARREGRASRR